MKIVWSPQAAEQVRDIASYIAFDKPAAAVEWVESVFNAVKPLENFPESGRMVPEIRQRNIRELILGNFRIIYHLHRQKIRIISVKRFRQRLSATDILSDE
ncbi:type II toxin-antitoxin system RelE/ParE family toxin [Oceanobacter antarcticus]|uniref:Type II toxin-antitoxin system RelE/ParE family toxin n=1 Tax=Oceanobacter antarcticus TaxID=3133425 RepID=A0ABW8NFW8_9GAMM